MSSLVVRYPHFWVSYICYIAGLLHCTYYIHVHVHVAQISMCSLVPDHSITCVHYGMDWDQTMYIHVLTK